MFLIRKDLCCTVNILRVKHSHLPCFSNQTQLYIPVQEHYWTLQGLVKWKCLTVDKTWGKCRKECMEQGIKVCVACVYPSLCSSRAREQLVTVSQPGMCRYGSRLDCCYGWKKNNKGHCEGNINTLCLFPLHSCVLGTNQGISYMSTRSHRKKPSEEWNLLMCERVNKTCLRDHVLKKTKPNQNKPEKHLG